MRRILVTVTGAALAVLAACDGPALDTRTYQLRYLPPREALSMVEPYVFRDRDDRAGTLSIAGAALTVRETPDNLAKIERMLEQFDRPQPLVMLHFQIIRANGGGDGDPAIAEVERELRRLFRFSGYELLAETRVGTMQGSGVRQIARGGGEAFFIEGGVQEVRVRPDGTTLTLELGLSTESVPNALRTQVTIPTGHAVVLGTAETESSGALIVVVRAELAGGAPAAADTATPG
ncbi:MAG TPA: hypothetical protein VM778_11130 [Gemmatimonadota bacterium]|nr:hypothetical protein [Gemmatimonadota bacterium]